MDSMRDIQVTVDDATGVALVRLDRPAKRNAFSQAMIGELVATLHHLDTLKSVRVAVLTGSSEGPFCGKFHLPTTGSTVWDHLPG